MKVFILPRVDWFGVINLFYLGLFFLIALVACMVTRYMLTRGSFRAWFRAVYAIVLLWGPYFLLLSLFLCCAFIAPEVEEVARVAESVAEVVVSAPRLQPVALEEVVEVAASSNPFWGYVHTFVWNVFGLNRPRAHLPMSVNLVTPMVPMGPVMPSIVEVYQANVGNVEVSPLVQRIWDSVSDRAPVFYMVGPVALGAAVYSAGRPASASRASEAESWGPCPEFFMTLETDYFRAPLNASNLLGGTRAFLAECDTEMMHTILRARYPHLRDASRTNSLVTALLEAQFHYTSLPAAYADYQEAIMWYCSPERNLLDLCYPCVHQFMVYTNSHMLFEEFREGVLQRIPGFLFNVRQLPANLRTDRVFVERVMHNAVMIRNAYNSSRNASVFFTSANNRVGTDVLFQDAWRQALGITSQRLSYQAETQGIDHETPMLRTVVPRGE